jgi:hypothetical protein
MKPLQNKRSGFRQKAGLQLSKFAALCRAAAAVKREFFGDLET